MKFSLYIGTNKYSLYLQIIYKELIYVIERNYPELLIESEKRYEILSWGG